MGQAPSLLPDAKIDVSQSKRKRYRNRRKKPTTTYITEEDVLLQPAIARAIIPYLDAIDLYNVLQALPTWKSLGQTPIMLANRSNYTPHCLKNVINSYGDSETKIGLVGGGPKVPSSGDASRGCGVMNLLGPVLLSPDTLFESNLVEVDIHQQSISILDYARFFDYFDRERKRYRLPHLRVLKSTVHGSTPDLKMIKYKFQITGRDLDTLWVHLVNVRTMFPFTCIYRSLQNARSVIWKQTRCRRSKTRARFTVNSGISHLEVSICYQLLEYVVRSSRSEKLFPDLETLCLRIPYSIKLDGFNVHKIAAAFPDVKISYVLSDEEFLMSNIGHRVPHFLAGPSDVKCPTNFEANRLSVVSYSLEAPPLCSWVTTQDDAPICMTLVIRCTDMKHHAMLSWSEHLVPHLTSLFTSHVFPKLQTYSSITSFLKKVVLPAEAVYFAQSSEDLYLPCVKELVIQSDVAILGYLPQSKEWESVICINTINLLRAFPNLQTLTMERNHLFNWLLVDRLPCEGVSELVVVSAGDVGHHSDATATLGAIFHATAALYKLRTLVVKLAGSVDYASLALASHRTCLQHLFVWCDNVVDLTAADVANAFTQAVRLHCLFVYFRATGRLFVRTNCDNGETQEVTIAPTKFLRQVVARWPEYFDAIWRHLFAVASGNCAERKPRRGAQ